MHGYHAWGRETLDAIERSQSLRQAARAAVVHHSAVQAHLETIAGLSASTPSLASVAPDSVLLTSSGVFVTHEFWTYRHRPARPRRRTPSLAADPPLLERSERDLTRNG